MSVFLTKNGKGRRIGVHRLVCWAFIGPQIGDIQVNHIDSNKRNNVVSNLEYLTRVENVRHSIRCGVSKPGYSARKLTDQQIELLRSLRKTCGVKELAEMFGLHKAHVSNLCNNKRRTKKVV